MFVYRARRGPKKRDLAFSEKAFNSNKMPVFSIPTFESTQRQSLFRIDASNLPSFPEINPSNEFSEQSLATIIEPLQSSVTDQIKIKRKYTKKTNKTTGLPVTRKSKRLQKEAIPAPSDTLIKKRGRPKKIGSAFSLD